MIIQEIDFKNINNKEFPDLKDYEFSFYLADIDKTIIIREEWTRGVIYVLIDDFICPFRINTNLLPPIYGNFFDLRYNYTQQKFIFSSIDNK